MVDYEYEWDPKNPSHLFIYTQNGANYVFDNYSKFQHLTNLTISNTHYISSNIEKFNQLETIIIGGGLPIYGKLERVQGSSEATEIMASPRFPKSIKSFTYYEKSPIFSKSLFGELTRLPNLEYFSLNCLEFEGYGNQDRFDPLEKLTQIKVLFLGGMAPRFPDEFYEGVDLEIVEFDNTSPLIITSLLSRIESLREIHINLVDFQDLANYAQEIGLLFKNNISDVLPEWIGMLDNLKSLSLRGLKLEKYPEWLFNMKSLENLNLEFNNLTYLDERLFTEMKLNFLNVSSNKINDPHILYKRSIPNINITTNYLPLEENKKLSRSMRALRLDIDLLPLEDYFSIEANFEGVLGGEKSERIRALMKENCRENATEIRRLWAEVKADPEE